MEEKQSIKALKHTIQELKREMSELERSKALLEESQEKYKNLVEHSLTGIYIDQDGKIIFLNQQFAEIYGYPREELVGMETAMLTHPEDRGRVDEIRTKCLQDKDAPCEYETRGITKNGRTIWVKWRNTDIVYQGHPAILGNVVDVTDRKETEAHLRETNKELEFFIHVVSHDLKTPVISINGFSDRLLRKYGDTLDEKGKAYIEHIMSSAAKVEALVSDLLTISRLGRMVPKVESHASREIVNEVVSDLQGRLKEGGVELTVAEDLPTIRCDRKRLQQVFQNLIENAAKFIQGVESPEIDIGYEDQGDFHQFSVTDNGIGIDPKDHQKIFEKFERLEDGDDTEGTGLGLAIVKRIVALHGGKVWVESEKGKGATFFFTLAKNPPVEERGAGSGEHGADKD